MSRCYVFLCLCICLCVSVLCDVHDSCVQPTLMTYGPWIPLRFPGTFWLVRRAPVDHFSRLRWSRLTGSQNASSGVACPAGTHARSLFLSFSLPLSFSKRHIFVFSAYNVYSLVGQYFNASQCFPGARSVAGGTAGSPCEMWVFGGGYSSTDPRLF